MKKYALTLLAALLMWAASADEVKTVVVGYHPATGTMIGANDGETKSGYAYDYIQEMATHTGWRYRYVYGGFNELYEKLKNGEIDLLPYVTRTARRERDVDFPNRPMGENRLYLIALNPEPFMEDIKALQGRRIGLRHGSYSCDVIRKFLAENGVESRFAEYNPGNDLNAALKNGDVDYIIETSMMSHHGEFHIVRELDMPHSIYVAVAKKRPDLLAELNAAQKESEELNPGFVGSLRWKHFKGNTVHREIGDAARKWLAEHRTIRIGTYNGDSFWIRVNPDGSYAGVLADYVDSLMKSLDIRIDIAWELYDGRESALAALHAGKIDLMGPYYFSYGDAERDGVLLSDQTFKCNFSVLHLGGYTRETMTVIATPSTRLGARYVRDNYPGARIVPCRNGADCIRALLAGEANSVVMNSEGLRHLANTYDEDFNIRPLNADCPISFVTLPRNKALLSIINRAIPFLTDVDVNAMFDKYGVDDSTQITARRFLERNPEFIFLGIAIFLIAALAVHVLRMRARQNRLEADVANRTLAFTNYFMDTFVSSYSVNLETREYSAYARDKRIEREYPVINDYVESLKSYIEREVVPEERKTLLEFIQPENIRQQLKAHPVIALSFRVNSPVGEKVFGLRVVRGSDENNVAFAFADVTDEARREKEHQRQVAMTVARTKFLFNVSHDVRTPVHAIMGFIDMCRDNLDDRDKVSGYLGQMKSSCGLLLSIIKSVLDMSRIEAGKARAEETCSDVMISFNEIEPTLRELADEKNIRLSFEFGEIRNRYVYSDYEKCSRVFVNIITNAIKYTPDGGKVAVKCEQLPDAADEAGRIARFRYTFADNGIGMSEEFQQQIYEQFAREQNTTMSGVGGLGLGMAIVKSFVDLLGGKVECRSKKGEGTTFTVTLPFRVQEGRKWMDPETGTIRDADQEAAAAKASAREAVDKTCLFTGKRALLVDDTKMSRMVALHYLAKVGFTVDTAADGMEGLEKAKANQYDIVMMDMQMPVMDGIESAKAMRAAGIKIPIIAWSANAFEEDREKALAAGMNDHIAKGVKAAVLVETIARYLGNGAKA